MRNIAKCKLCKDIIESFHPTDFVFCKCGEIAVSGGLGMHCSAKNFNNFLRVDDKGNEIVVTYKEDSKKPEEFDIVTKKDLLTSLDEHILYIENMPDRAKLSNTNYYDLLSLMVWLSSFFKSRD